MDIGTGVGHVPLRARRIVIAAALGRLRRPSCTAAAPPPDDPNPDTVATVTRRHLRTLHDRLRSTGIATTIEEAMMRWLVTGGAGFIGTNLATHLIDSGDEP